MISPVAHEIRKKYELFKRSVGIPIAMAKTAAAQPPSGRDSQKLMPRSRDSNPAA